MVVRDNYTADWVFALKNSIEKVVEQNFPLELHTWPILKAFNFEAFIWTDRWLILVLKDKISGVIAGPGNPEVFIDSNAPASPNCHNIIEWQKYLTSKYELRPQDACIIIPIYDCGKNDVKEDWKSWSEAEKNLWHRQIEMIVNNHFYYRRGINSLDGFYIPPGYQFLREEVAHFLNDNPCYDKNIFIMTRFVPGNKLLEALDRELRKVLKANGLNPLRADDKMYMRDRNLWNNVCIYMIGCENGIAILEDRIANEFNPNVALEYGFMRALNKPTLLLADIGFRNLRADIIGTLRETFDITDIENTIKLPVEKWIGELK